MTQNPHSETRLYMAMELGNEEWKLAFGEGASAIRYIQAAQREASSPF